MSQQYGFRVAHNTISLIIPYTCEAIIAEYLEVVLSCTQTPEQWKEVAAILSQRWNFHHTVGALDGKHVVIRCPPKGGSKYYNYKGFQCIVMITLIETDYEFLYVT